MTEQDSDRARETLLSVRNLTVEFPMGRRHRPFRAVDSVSFEIRVGQTLGLVGESGSGKSTIGRAILGLAPVKSGTIMFAGRDITRAGHRDRRSLSADLQVVFQDPYSSLNPTRTVGQTLGEVLTVHGKQTKADRDRRAREMLERVGLPSGVANRFPLQFSGGQRQRIAIARALMTQPRLVICDEPVSALDLSIQAQVLNLLQELQQEFDLSYLFVAHDLAVVRHVASEIMVLYRGQVMEYGKARPVYDTPRHPYTQALLAAAPLADPELQRRRRAKRVLAQLALPNDAQSGCPFAPRCPHVITVCREHRPQLEVTDKRSLVACHRWAELAQPNAPEPASSAV